MRYRFLIPRLLLLTLLAIRANAEKIKTMAEDGVPGVGNQFLRQIGQAAQLGINDALALDTNEMGMRVGFAAIVPVVARAEFQFQHFSQFLHDRDGLVDCRQAGSRKVHLDLLEDVLNTRVPVALHQQPQDS